MIPFFHNLLYNADTFECALAFFGGFLVVVGFPITMIYLDRLDEVKKS